MKKSENKKHPEPDNRICRVVCMNTGCVMHNNQDNTCNCKNIMIGDNRDCLTFVPEPELYGDWTG